MNPSIDQMIADVEAAATHVPLGNSAFQDSRFIQGHEAPARRMKALCNNVRRYTEALKECRWRRERHAIDLEEIEERLATAEGRERRRIEIDRDEKRSRLADEEKLIADAVASLAAIHREIMALPPVESREAFEAAELPYWIERLVGDAVRETAATGRVGVGTLAALAQIGVQTWEVGQAGQITVTGPAAALLLGAPK